MTPYQEAVSLVNAYKEYTEDTHAESWSDAKSCAIIAVDLVIGAMGKVLNDAIWDEFSAHTTQASDYWQEVKKQIALL